MTPKHTTSSRGTLRRIVQTVTGVTLNRFTCDYYVSHFISAQLLKLLPPRRPLDEVVEEVFEKVFEEVMVMEAVEKRDFTGKLVDMDVEQK